MGRPGATEAPSGETVGQRIFRLRTERGLSQRGLSEPGVSDAYLSRIESGERRPSVAALRILARKLGVSLEYLETGRETPAHLERLVRLESAELALRLEHDAAAAEESLVEVLGEAEAAGDELALLRASIALGLALLRRGEYRQAVTHLARARHHGSVTALTHPELFMALGQALAACGNPERAAAVFEESIAELDAASDPDAVHGLRLRLTSYLSCALADAGRFEDARDVLLDIEPGSADPTAQAQHLWAASRTASMQGDAPAAVTAMQRAISLLETTEDTRQLARAHLHCSQVLLLEGAADRARPHLAHAERLLRLGPDQRDVGVLRTQQAFLAVADGDGETATKLATEAVELLTGHDTGEGSACYALAQGLELLERHEEAGTAYSRAAEKLTATAEWREAIAVYRAWATMLRAIGREAEAFATMEQATMLSLRHLARGRTAPATI